MLIRTNRLTDFATTIFASAGAAEENARETAEHLVLANLKGHDSHGVGMIPTYVDAIHAGGLVPNANIETLRDQGAVLCWTANSVSARWSDARPRTSPSTGSGTPEWSRSRCATPITSGVSVPMPSAAPPPASSAFTS